MGILGMIVTVAAAYASDYVDEEAYAITPECAHSWDVI